MKLTPAYLLLAMLCTSCAAVYVPQARNVPLFSQAGEFNGNVSAGSSGLNVQSAYAVSNQFGVMANFMTANSDGNSPYRRQTAGDIGVGYYLRKRVAFEVYTGVGLGKGWGTDSTSFSGYSSKTLSGKYQRYFVQPSLGVYGSRFEGGFTLRVSALHFRELNLWLDGEEYPISRHTRWFIEPSVTTKYYPYDKRFYILAQFGICGLMTEENVALEQDLDYEPFNLTIGLGVKLKRK